MIRGFKIRLFPDEHQKELILKSIGACRFIWNYMIDKQNTLYQNNERHMTAFDMSCLLSNLKKDEKTAWLSEVSAISLVLTCRELGDRYQRFYKKTDRLPKYKTKKNKHQSYPVSTRSINFGEKTVNIEKIGKIKYKTDFILPKGKTNEFKNARISIVEDKVILSFCLEVENGSDNLDHKGYMGIDLGVKELAVASYENNKYVFPNINKSKKIRQLNKRIIKTQKSMSRKYKASIKKHGEYVVSKNIEKERKKFYRMNKKVADIRLNYIHQITAKLTSMLPICITVENLDIRDLMKNKFMSKQIHDQNFGEFIRQIEYKSEAKNIKFVKADRFFPSSKTCSKCGTVKRNLKLSDRIFRCDSCGFIEDRDYNAAINLMKYGAHA